VRLFRSKRDAPAADEAQPRRLQGKRDAPAADEAQPRRRRRAPRADGPRTIIPMDVPDEARPSWLPADTPEANPFALKLDAARERLRREIPPVSDDL
jgi:hypothetical protein